MNSLTALVFFAVLCFFGATCAEVAKRPATYNAVSNGGADPEGLLAGAVLAIIVILSKM